MSEREKAIQLLNELPDEKMAFVVSYLQGMKDSEDGMPPEMLEKFARFLHGISEMIPSREALEKNAGRNGSFTVIDSRQTDK